jgi:hypothetical protein
MRSDETRAPSEAGPRPGEPGESRIRDRAHAIWVEEGRPDGKAIDHWLRARWELENPGPSRRDGAGTGSDKAE